MDGLMQMENESGNKLSDWEILGNIVSLVVAGHESTSFSSMWAIYYLAKYPKDLEKPRVTNQVDIHYQLHSSYMKWHVRSRRWYRFHSWKVASALREENMAVSWSKNGEFITSEDV